MGSVTRKRKRASRINDVEYVNKYCLEHKEEVAFAVDNFPKDKRFMERCMRLREAILRTRDDVCKS